MMYRITFEKLPTTLAELQALPQAKLQKPEDTAALTVAALCAYPESPEDCFEMLNFLRGPRPLSVMEKQFIRDRFLDGKDYIPRSYFAGATPENDYTPSVPYAVEFTDSVTPVAEDGYKRFDVRSGGADTARPITLRHKPSTGEWFLWEQILLAGIRAPKSRDAWA